MERQKQISEIQSDKDRSMIKVKLIENGILVGAGPDGWFSFSHWEGPHGAAEHIGERLERLKRERTENPRP